MILYIKKIFVIISIFAEFMMGGMVIIGPLADPRFFYLIIPLIIFAPFYSKFTDWQIEILEANL
jgi:hypothetical protein